MILPVYVYGQPVLRKVAEDITPDYPNLKELIQNMFETMDHADGVGLAAPQIGLPIRVVVVDLDVLSEDYPEYKGFRKAYINAHILEVSGEEVSMEEGCLSLPGIHESVIKPMHFFGLLGSLMFIFGFIAVVIVGVSKLYYMHHGMPYRLVTDSPYFYLSLTSMIIGTQLFVAGFLGELISRNAPERNKYQIEKTI